MESRALVDVTLPGVKREAEGRERRGRRAAAVVVEVVAAEEGEGDKGGAFMLMARVLLAECSRGMADSRFALEEWKLLAEPIAGALAA